MNSDYSPLERQAVACPDGAALVAWTAPLSRETEGANRDPRDDHPEGGASGTECARGAAHNRR
jgi:hypothetical protein